MLNSRSSASNFGLKLVIGVLVVLAGVALLVHFIPLWKLERAVRKDVSSKLPALRKSQEAQVKAIGRSRVSLTREQMPTQEMYFCVSAANLEQVIPDLLKDRLPEIKTAHVHMGHQELITELSFQHHEDRYRATVNGEATVHTTAEVFDGKLKLISHVTDLKVSSVSISKLGNVSLIGSAFNLYVGQLKEQIDKKLEQPPDLIPLSVVQTVQPKDVLTDKGFLNLSGPNITFAAAMGSSALLIDNDGIHVVANLVELTPTLTKRVIAELKTIVEQNSPNQLVFTSQQIAMLSRCGLKLLIDSPEEALEYQSFVATCGVLQGRRTREAASAGDHGTATAQVEKDYSELAAEFKQMAITIAPLRDLGWGTTGIAVSKSFISAELNDFAGDPHYRGTYRSADFPFSNRQEVTTDKATNLNCDKIACDADYGKCVPTWNCYGRGCPGGCGLFDVGCHAWKPVCEVLKAAEQTGCVADKVRFQSQCNATTAVEKATCETKKTGCFANQAWLNTWSEKQIGLVESNGQVQNLAINFELSKLITTATLDQITVTANSEASGEINGNAKFTPRDLGNLVCTGQWNGTLQAGISSENVAYSVTSRLQTADKEGDDLVLVYASDALPISLKFHPSPFQALLDHNPQLYIQCVGGVIGRLSGAGFREDYPYTVPSKETKIHFSKNSVVVLGTTLYLYPEWSMSSKAIQFHPKSPRWKL